MPSTSAIAAGIAVEGFQLQFGNGASPEVFTTVCNVSDFQLPLVGDTVEVTNVGDKWKRRISTLLDMGKMTFKVFWVMTEPTHMNVVTGAIRGIRYLFIQQLLVNCKAIYNDGSTSTDYFPAYVTKFDINGKVGGVFEASIELTNSGPPTMV
jgi:hypothetical protein